MTTPERNDHMSDDIYRGPLRTYEIIWKSGHVETIQAHQVLCPHDDFLTGRPDPWFRFHGEFDGKWTLVLQAREEDILSVRMVPAPAEAAS